jgi:heme exporter protein C
VVGIVGALDIPLIHLSVVWFRSLHPAPVVMKPEGPSLDPAMLATLFVGLGASTLVFLSFFLFRYGLERMTQALAHREMAAQAAPRPEGAPS